MHFYVYVLFFSVSWQHMLCKTPQPDAEVKTLFVDHVCAPSTGALTPAPVNNTHVGSSHNGGTFRPIAMQAVSQQFNKYHEYLLHVSVIC